MLSLVKNLKFSHPYGKFSPSYDGKVTSGSFSLARTVILLTLCKSLKLRLLSKKIFIAGGLNGPCWDARGTSGIITFGEQDPEATSVQSPR